MRLTRVCVGVLVCLTAGGGAMAEGRMVGVSWLGGLYEIDLATGGTTSLGSLGVSRLNSLAMRSDGTLWTARAGDVDTGEPSRLYTIDPVSVTATLVTEMDPSVDVRGLSWTNDGDLVAMLEIPGTTAQYARIDPVTGAITNLAGFAGHNRSQSLETTPDGDMVVWDIDSGIYRFADDGSNFTQLSPVFQGSESIQSLSFAADGNLYGSSTEPIAPQASRGVLFLIDQETWLPIRVGQHDTPFDMRGMAYIPAPGAGVWLIGAGMIAARRRR